MIAKQCCDKILINDAQPQATYSIISELEAPENMKGGREVEFNALTNQLNNEKSLHNCVCIAHAQNPITRLPGYFQSMLIGTVELNDSSENRPTSTGKIT